MAGKGEGIADMQVNLLTRGQLDELTVLMADLIQLARGDARLELIKRRGRAGGAGASRGVSGLAGVERANASIERCQDIGKALSACVVKVRAACTFGTGRPWRG